jgi:hypothetical protein
VCAIHLIETKQFFTGGSTILLLFEPGKMAWDDDLVDNSNSALETLVCTQNFVLVTQSLISSTDSRRHVRWPPPRARSLHTRHEKGESQSHPRGNERRRTPHWRRQRRWLWRKTIHCAMIGDTTHDFRDCSTLLWNSGCLVFCVMLGCVISGW